MPHLMGHQYDEQGERERRASQQIRRIMPHTDVAGHFTVKTEREIRREALRQAGAYHCGTQKSKQKKKCVKPVALAQPTLIRHGMRGIEHLEEFIFGGSVRLRMAIVCHKCWTQTLDTSRFIRASAIPYRA